MNELLTAYRRLDLLQQTRLYQLVASVIVLLACGGLFGSLIFTSYSINWQRGTLIAALENQNLERRDEHAVSLRETGTVTVGGRTYQTHEFAHSPELLFDEYGTIAVPHYLADDLLYDQIPAWAPFWLLEQPGTTILLAIVFTFWFLLIVWMNISVPFILTLLGTSIPVGIAWLLGSEGAMIAFGGIGLLTFTYVLLTRTALLLLERPNQILAVAHTVIKEASRSRISLVFIVLLLVLLPMLPLFLDPSAPLRYRIQTFISRSIGLTFALAAFMTIFLSCATVAFEIRDRQIWHLVTKPLSRWNYLLGKWLGVVIVNFILLSVAGVSTFTFIQYLRTTPVAPGIEGQLDAVQVNNEVLAARVARKPTYDVLSGEDLRVRIEQQIARDPELAGTDVPNAVRREIADRIRQAHSAAQRTIPAQTARTYVFENLHEARKLNATLTFRYRFHILRSDQHETYPVYFIFNEDHRTLRMRDYVPTMSHVVMIGPDVVRPDGSLSITVVNPFEPPPELAGYGFINFEEKDFEILYKVANFEGNFFRATLIALIKLSFLAMLGIACSTFLSFPVACLLSFTVFGAGTIAPFLAMSVEEYEPVPIQYVDWTNIAFVAQWLWHTIISGIAQGVVFLLGAFGEFRPTEDLVQGKLIPWSRVATGFLLLGVLWSGAALIAGYSVIRSRQLAIYSGQG